MTGVSAAAGPGSATVSWSAPSSGGAPTSYKVTPYIGSTAQATKTVTGSPLPTSTTVSGLTPGQSYTFTVQASNAIGDGPSSGQSNAVTPRTAVTTPGAPTGIAATARRRGPPRCRGRAPANNGGSPITGYTITPYIGSTAQADDPAAASATSASVTGLTNNTTYTFTVKATNAIGTGPESTSSNAVTPQIPTRSSSTSTPTTVDSGDGNPVELGVKFTTDVGGTINGVRFYKASTNTGTHVGSLWTTTGTLLARRRSATSPRRAGSRSLLEPGHDQPQHDLHRRVLRAQRPLLGRPARVHVGRGQLHRCTRSPTGRAPTASMCTAPASTFPTSTFSASNYFVDVVFAPAPPRRPAR